MSYLIYFIQVSLYAGIMWGIYCLAWRNRPLYNSGRAYLLASLLLPLALPFVRLPIADTSAIGRYRVDLPQISVTSTSGVQIHGQFSWLQVGLYIYVIGVFALGVLYTVAYFRIHRHLLKGKKQNLHGYQVITETGIGPGTIGQTIFFPGKMIDELILKHELAHVDAGHRIDNVLLQILHVLLWPSPAHWLIGRELKMLHEFEADRQASGINAYEYAEELLGQAFGIKKAITVGHSFYHHPIKRRILMLQKKQAPRKALLLFASLVLTGAFVTTVLFAQTRKPKNTMEGAGAREKAVRVEERDGNIKENAQTTAQGKDIYKFVEQMPEFKGDLSAWLGSNLHYPDSARARNEQGRSVVQFVVDEEGNIIQPRIVRSSGYTLLDDEALRVVHSMPKWNPGMQQGKKVPVYYTLPVSYKLD